MGHGAGSAKDPSAVKLHPLVVLNITDHWTRNTVRAGTEQQVAGALLGEQTGHAVEVFTSFELVASEEDPGRLDMTYLDEKKAHYNAVFPTYEIVGWYLTGSSISDAHRKVHRDFMRYHENPLLLQFETKPPQDATTLPLSIYEASVQVQNDTPVTTFAKVPYIMESEESERISVDNVAHGTGAHGVVTPLRIYRDALVALKQRIGIVRQYLERVADGTHPPQHTLLREIKALCAQLPLDMSPQLQQAYAAEYTDTLLVAYLASLTRTCASMNRLLEGLSAA